MFSPATLSNRSCSELRCLDKQMHRVPKMSCIGRTYLNIRLELLENWKAINPATDSSCCAATNTLQAATRFFRHTEGGDRGIVIVSVFLSKFMRSQVELRFPLLARKPFLDLVSGNFENMPFSIFCCHACLAGFGLQNVDPLLHWCFVGRQRRASLSFKDSFRKTKFRVPFWRAETKRAHQSESRRMFLALPWHVMTHDRLSESFLLRVNGLFATLLKPEEDGNFCERSRQARLSRGRFVFACRLFGLRNSSFIFSFEPSPSPLVQLCGCCAFA